MSHANGNRCAVLGVVLLAVRSVCSPQNFLEQIGDANNHAVTEGSRIVKDVTPIQIDLTHGGKVIVNGIDKSYAFTPGSGQPPVVTDSPAYRFWTNLPGQTPRSSNLALQGEDQRRAPIPWRVTQFLSMAGIPSRVPDRERFSTDWGATANGTLQEAILGNGHARAVTLE